MNYQKTHPELFKSPYAETLNTKTLTELNVKSSAEAEKEGCFCIRPANNSGKKSWPGLWLLPEDAAKFPDLLLKIEAERTSQTSQSSQRLNQKQAKTIRANEAAAVRELAKQSGMHPSEVIGLLQQEYLAEIAKAPQEAYKKLLKMYAPEWQSVALNQASLKYVHPSGFSVDTVDKDLCVALLKKNQPEFLAILDESLTRQQRKAYLLTTKWMSSKPDWFTDEQLRSWSVQAGNGKNTEHPLLADPVFRTLLESPLQVKYAGKEVKVSVSKEDALRHIWALPLLETGSPSAEIIAIFERLVGRQLDEALNTFVRNTLVTLDLEQHGFTPDAAEQYLKKAFIACVSDKFNIERISLAARARVSTQLARRHIELALELCRGELPKEWKDFYPLARSMNRKITFVHGPTNSGKTYTAMKLLKASETGAYMGPLRLLALEVFERLNADGLPTSLVTGELMTDVEGSKHIAATIEMLDLNTPVDVVVVDEVQMLSDKDRGSAWLQAVLGAPAKHLVLLGSPSALQAVRMLAKITGESLEEIALERLNPLKVTDKVIQLKDAPDGSALIVFSRQAALSLASHMRAKYNKKVSVVYGALSPEVRSEQARQFREGESQLIVSTDAIGMGLNLPVGNVIFTTLTKWNGEAEVQLDHSLACQIAGRAGRYGLQEAGFASCMNNEDQKVLRKMLDRTIASIKPPFGVSLNLETAQSISRHLKTESLSEIIAFFQQSMHLESWAEPVSNEDQLFLAGYLDRFLLSLPHKLLLSNAPAMDKGSPNSFFHEMVSCVEQQREEDMAIFTQSFDSNLQMLEGRVKDTTLYQWMHYRFRSIFPRLDEAQATLTKLNALITKLLSNTPGRQCTQCRVGLAWDYAFGKCENCFSSGCGARNGYGYNS